MNDFDKRQLLIMKQKIDAFISNDLYLEYLIEDLGSLLELLEENDPHWIEKLWENWTTLEITMSMSLADNNGKLVFTSEQVDKIHTSIEKLKRLVEFKLNEHEKNEEKFY